MNIKNWFQDFTSRKALCILGTIIIALIIFRAGMYAGFRQASFSYRFGERYYQTFGRSRGSNMVGGYFRDAREQFGNPQGVSGKILKISLPTVVIEGQDGMEKVVLISDNTIVRHQRDSIKASDLRVDDEVILIGTPNDKSEIEARLIRIMPALSLRASTTTSSK